MKATMQIDVTFDQLLSLVKQLPRRQKLKLTKELEREIVGSKLSKLLKSFEANELSLETIDDEVEKVRQEIYDKQKH
ncbi:type II toxin-antitoxin system VapB15 family antitoxin [Parapedobacter tibetensis]|uniref:type II toxin-antitoxin system VapB15 family antitoxin n=1 Tax=Parapedobacter tibetensis TaxID=2972951 RepID=UPI00214D8254|nr:hypothetical protein [Parapedobacter tibetensis]